MSDDLDKLAAEMQSLRPSNSARENGFSAAMAAFEMEFAAEAKTLSLDETSIETNNLEESLLLSQGLSAARRPTDQTTAKAIRQNRVQTFGRLTMSRFNKIFDFTPKTAMIGSSCMTALLASIVVFQAMPFETPPPAAEPNAVAALDGLVVETPKIEAPTPPMQTDPSLDLERPKPVQPAGKRARISTPKEVIAPTTVQSAPETTSTQPIAEAPNEASRPTNTAVIERRVMISPAQTVERVIPSPSKQVTRRRIKTPARTTERIIPEVTKEVTRRVEENGKMKTVTETVVVQPQSVEYISVPAEYETYTETVVVQEGSTELVTIPPVYGTVRETIELQADGSTRVIGSETVPLTASADPMADMAPPPIIERQSSALPAAALPSLQNRTAEFKGISSVGELLSNVRRSTSASQSKYFEKYIPPKKISAPAVTKQVSRRVLKTPASTQERIVPAITKDVEFRVQREDGTMETVTKTVVVQEARTELITLPPVYETITETVVVRPEYGIKPPSRGKFENYESNPVISVEQTPVSTFSIDVDTASYAFLRASLNRGQLPPPGAIRLEEMINYFPYDYDAPKSADKPFKANVTVTSTPWNTETKLMHIGIKGYVPPAKERPRSNIVLLIDTSGSMNRFNKLPLLINSFKLLLNTLNEDDTVSIVTYAGSAGTVLEPTPASEKSKINAALQRLRAGGSTAGAAGLELAYIKAQESFDDEGVNRIILATDGDFNVGFSSHEEMKTYISKKRDTGIFLSVLGFGLGNYNDQLMQSLAQNGNGIAAYIDTLAEANKVLANEAGSALFTIAKDVKIQVEFNPDTISEYRLIGYETRGLKREDFNNDKVDAGEIGAGHSVTAIYELTPVGSSAKVFDQLRYAADEAKPRTPGSDEFAFVKIRHKLPSADKSTLQTFPVGKSQERTLRRANDDVRFAAVVAAVGQKLRGDTQLANYSYSDAIKLASGAKGKDENGYRAEFVQLIRLAESLQE